MKKLFVVAVILLFIGLAFAPNINANIDNTTNECELVEVTTEICRIPGMKSNTVKFTQEQIDELDALFDSIEIQLDNVVTREDTIKVFNEAIVELDKYGLLGGLNVKQVQKMITGRFQNSRFIQLLENIYTMRRGTQGVDENLNCLVAGNTNETAIMPGIYPMWMGLFSKFERLLQFIITFAQIRPFYLFPGALIEINKGTGWVFTIGMNSTKSWKGTLIGRYEEANKWAVLGFAGLNILLDYKDLADNWWYHRHFYLGFARHVIIEEI